MAGTRTRSSFLLVVFVAATLIGVAPPSGVRAATPVSINELRIDQPGAEDDEYFELAGEPGGSLDGLSYLVIGDGAGGSGVIEAVVDLTGQTIPASAFFLVAESTLTLGSPDLVVDLNFENSDNVTHLLVRDFGGSFGQDLDTDDDGALDLTPWSAVVDQLALTEDAYAGDHAYGLPAIGPDGRFVPGHVFRCPDATGEFRIGAFAGGSDTPGAANACATSTVRIHDVQGGGTDTPLDGQTVAVQGVVTSLFEDDDDLDGFFLQEEDADADADAATSEGIFVFCGGDCPAGLAEGDLATVEGRAAEFFGMTQLVATSSSGSTTIDGTAPLPTPTPIDLPASGPTDAADTFEPVEGMVVSFPDTLVVSEYFELARYGQIVLTAEDRPFQFTHTDLPSVAGYEAFLDDLATRRIILDDDNNDQNDAIFGPDADEPYPYPAPGLSTTNRFRGGETIDGLTGVLHWSWAGSGGTDAWRIRPIASETYGFASDGAAPTSPDEVSGSLRVAAFNVLNYFMTIDTTSSRSSGPCGPSASLDCRGADSEVERERQLAKIVATIEGLDADVVGLVELENDGDDAAIASIVGALNAAGGPTWSYVSTGFLGDDAIKVGLIHTDAVEVIGVPAVLDTPGFVDPLGTGEARNRPALAAAFRELATGQVTNVVVNHLKSKGSSGLDCSSPTTTPDCDQGDGQANFNATRTAGAIALAEWIDTDPTASGDPDWLITGDLNAYRNEDPIRALEDRGYVDLIERFVGDGGYSYVFDGQLGYLDHALANPTLAEQVTGTTEWHINADEVNVFDYNDAIRDWPGEASFERESAALELFSPDAFRSSDHDPVLAGFDLTPLTCGGLEVTIQGTGGDDILMGTEGDDVIHALGGHDVVHGGNGQDTVCGGRGDDTIDGGNGKDHLDGGDGDDAIDGGNGKDHLDGGSDDDTLDGGHGQDTGDGGPGHDSCVAIEHATAC